MPTAQAAHSKPSKPYPSFPLTPHNNGQWCKKVRGTVHFFGVWSDWSAALKRYEQQAADLHSGRSPQPSVPAETVTIKMVGNAFLTYQLEKVQATQISGRWFEDCRRVVVHFAKCMGKDRTASHLRGSDFQRYRRILANVGLTGDRGLGVYALTRAIAVVKGMFMWASDTSILDETPRWGRSFQKPSAIDMRRSRQKAQLTNGKKLFTCKEINALIDTATPALRTAILLGINGGFGNSDIASLPLSAIDLVETIIDFDRPKTAVRRIVPLWPETAKALHTVIDARRASAVNEAASGLAFMTETGRPLVRTRTKLSENDAIPKVTYIDRLGVWFDDLLQTHGMKRSGIGFYTLRRTFRTWADEVRDQHAIHRIMGHAIPGMAGIYVEEISIERLRAVTDHVRAKLFNQ